MEEGESETIDGCGAKKRAFLGEIQVVAVMQ